MFLHKIKTICFKQIYRERKIPRCGVGVEDKRRTQGRSPHVSSRRVDTSTPAKGMTGVERRRMKGEGRGGRMNKENTGRGREKTHGSDFPA